MNSQLSINGVKSAATVRLRARSTPAVLRKQRGEEGATGHFNWQGTQKFPTRIHTQNERFPLRVNSFIGILDNNSKTGRDFTGFNWWVFARRLEEV